MVLTPLRGPIRISLLEGVHPKAASLLETDGYKVRALPHSPSGEELDQILAESDVVGIRSKTVLKKEHFERHPHLMTVGCFCIGTDQVDLTSASKYGVPVFNAPYSNTRSVAELVIAEVISLARQLGDRNLKAHQGIWLKSADGSHEVRGKTLGIVGYGHIGSQVSVLAESLGMRVIYFDVVKKLPLGNSQPKSSFEDLLREADFVSLHVPDTKQTKRMMHARHFKAMKRGAKLINASRGSVVDIPELAEALRSGQLGGAAVDVFPLEPSSNKETFKSELQGLPNVILTPHIGGSTSEAQEAIGLEVAHSFLGFLQGGSTRGSVNFPHVDLPWPHGKVERLLNVHANVPGVLREINSIVSAAGANIIAQALATDPQIGYVIFDMEHGPVHDIKSKIDALSTSIKTRALQRETTDTADEQQ